MLRFNPQHQLILTPNPQKRLQGTLTISNVSPRAAPFKVKSTRPSLFTIEPASGFLLSNQSKDIVITTRAPTSGELAHEISFHNKFLIEFALIEKVPNSLAEGLKMINEDNRQQHKLFLSTTVRTDKDNFEVRSGISNRSSYRTVVGDEDTARQGSGRNIGQERDNYEGMNNDQKFEYLTRQVERLEREKSELIIISKPKQSPNIWKLAALVVIMIFLGNLLGGAIGLKQNKVMKKHKEEGWLSKLGLHRFWKEEKQKQTKDWWQFWK